MLDKRVATTLVSLLANVCLLAGTVEANIAIKPAFLEVDMNEGRPSGIFMISNLGEKEERFRVNAVHFTYTEKGGLVQSQTGEYSLAPWIRFNPRELTLAPKTQRAVRFAVIPRGPLSQGEWWAAMELESLEMMEIAGKTDTKGRSTKVKAVTSIMVPIFGGMGTISYEGQITDVQMGAEHGSAVLQALVSATGTGRLGLAGTYEILDASGATVSTGPFGNAYVLRGAQRWLTRPVEGGITGSQYAVRISLNAAHLQKPLTIETRVTWPEVPPMEEEATALPAAQPASGDSQKQPESTKDGKYQEAQGSAGS